MTLHAQCGLLWLLALGLASGMVGTAQRCYNCMVATADDLSGPWSEAYLAIPHGGHNVFFQDKQGHWWATFFGHDSLAPFRERPAILRINMDDERRIEPRTDLPSARKESLR